MSKILAARFANTPVLAADTHAEWFGQCLSAASAELAEIRIQEQASPPAMQDDFWPEQGSWMAAIRPYKVVNGTLVIPVKGVLLHDFGYQLFDWATGYTYIRKAFDRGMDDPQVQRIAFVIQSGGGEVAGNFDLVDHMYSRRGEKPVEAFVDEHAYSAAFNIASLARKIHMPRTGGVGSVGVVTAHGDYSKMYDNAGIKVTFVHAGKHKVDGNSFEPLPEDVKNRMQARIDGLHNIFVASVARNLGLEEQAVRATEALTYSAEEAVSIGFAHEIRPVDEALAAYTSGPEETIGDFTMSQEQQIDSAFTQADLDAARAEGKKEGAAAERERIQAILGSDEAQNRRELAFHLSLKTDQSVEVAKSILAASPEEKAEEPETTTPGANFAAAMQNGNPNIGGEGGDGGEGEEADAGQLLIRDYQAATGRAN